MKSAERPSSTPLVPGWELSVNIDTQIVAEQVASVHLATPLPLFAGFVFAALLSWVVWPQAPHLLVAGWLLLKLLLGALRLLEVGAWQRDPNAAARPDTWARRYLAPMLLDALSWSAAPILFMPFCAGPTNLLLLAGAVGVTAVSVFTTYFHARIGLAYLSAMILPLALDQGLHHGPAGRFMAASLLLYLAVLGLETLRGARRVVQTQRLRYENAAIAEERHRALILAEHSSATKTRFLAAISHELRTPLNGILGMAELLRAANTDTLAAQRLEVLQRSALHLQSVINDLLDLSRVEFGKLDLDEDCFNPSELLHEVTDLLAPLAAQRQLGFHVITDPALPQALQANPGRIKQVLHNLLGNALKFTPRGEVRVHMVWADDMLMIEVSDTGPGIAAEHIERIFDAFAQGDGEAAIRRSCTGLGLNLSRQMARAMGGDVLCQSTMGLGATFRFSVLAQRAPPAAVMAADPLAAPRPWARFTGHVLVADDNPVNALVATAFLEQFGITSDVAEDGLQALALMAQRRHALVLMDCLMPNLSGPEATRQWRAREAAEGWSHLPVIALTANAAPGEREKCLAAGMHGFITKPDQQHELAEALALYWPGPRHGDAAPAPRPTPAMPATPG